MNSLSLEVAGNHRINGLGGMLRGNSVGFNDSYLPLYCRT